MSEALATLPATPAFQKLVAKLREIFQIDQPDLDFGIYRIINARAAEIGDYLENQLRAKVDASLASGQQAGLADLQRELAAAEQQARDLGADPATLPKVKDLRDRVAALSGGASGHRDAVFSHLLTFFSRYYDRGDFISQRRYKGDTYAIPYAGEEVVLHWANKDQYYTKSGENFSNYTWSLADGRRVHFRLASADTAKDDRKDTDLERRFRLIAPRTITRIGDDGEEVQEQQVPIVEVAAVPAAEGRPATTAELILWFEYVPLPKKGDSQEVLNTRARDTVLADAAVKARWLDLAQRKPTEKNPQRTLLDKQLEDYTQKNKADYFIHKDLGGFLRRELDFYIKNEVMHLDDVQNAASFADIEKSLRLIQCLRAIALDLIAFLAQLEDFQKKLWLKKKFVVEAHYCITLDRLYKLGEDLDAKDTTRPGVLAEREWLLAQITANEKQIAAWIDLGLVKDKECEPVVASTDPLFAQAKTVAERLRANPFLMVDTQWFSTEFKYRLLAQLHDLDAQCDGLLVHSENFQALRLLRNRYNEGVECTYIDPPYNTDGDGFAYKDSYKHSTWLSCFGQAIQEGRLLLSESGSFFFSIDDGEAANAWELAKSVFGEKNYSTEFIWEKKKKPSFLHRNVGKLTDFIFAFNRNASRSAPFSIETTTQGKKTPINNAGNALGLLRFPPGSVRFGISDGTIPAQDMSEGNIKTRPVESIEIKGGRNAGELILEGEWRYSQNKLTEIISEGGDIFISKIPFRPNHIKEGGETKKMKNILSPTHYDMETNEDASAQLQALFPGNNFKNPKPEKLIRYIVRAVTYDKPQSVVLDYFGGSGTTGASVTRACLQNQ